MLFTFRYVFLAKQFSTSSTTVVYGWQKLYKASEKVFCNSTIFGWGWLTWHSRLRFEKCIENLPDVIWITIESLSKSWIRMGCHFQSFSILVSILFFFCENWKFQHWKILHWDAYPKVNYACRSGCSKTVISTNFKHFLMVMGINLLGILLHTIRKVQFLSKNSTLTSFSPNFFMTIFLVNSKLSTAKKCKTAAFSWVFTQNNSTIFLGKSKLNY